MPFLPRGNLANDAAQAIAAYDVPVCPITIGQRAAYSNALTLGLTAQEYEPSGKASEEIRSLYLWLCQQLNM
jgi:chromosome partitioning protein